MRWAIYWIIPCSNGAPIKILLFMQYIRSVEMCPTLDAILELQLSAVSDFFPLSFPSLFSKSIPSPPERSQLSDVPFVSRSCPSLFDYLGCCNKPINKSLLSHGLKFGTNWLWEYARLCEIIWLISLLLKHHYFKENLNFHRSQFFFFFGKKIKWGFYFYLVEWRRGADPRSNLATRFGARFSSSPTSETRDAFDGTQPCASESSGFRSASPGWPQQPTHGAPPRVMLRRTEPSRVAPAVLGQSGWVWAHSWLLPNPRGSPQESGESWNPQPERAFPPSPVQLIPGTFSPRARDGSGVGSERRSKHIPLRIPASPPRLQGFFSFPLFNYIQGSFTGFAITLIAFRDDISFAENAIGVPAMLCRGGKFIWMLLIPL